jgi:hypothetical protein
MPVDYYRILDFDQTITKEHTFQDASITEENKHLEDDFFGQGVRAAAAGNVKDALPEVLLQMNSKHAFGIATYHNNPDYIAGYMQHVLGKKVTLSWMSADRENPVAVHAYRIEGSTQTLLIAHIAKTVNRSDDLPARFNNYDGKNAHISALQRFAAEEKLVDENTFYDFFDDSEQNVKKARKLQDIDLCSHQVLGNNHRFQVENQEAFEAAMRRASVKHAAPSEEALSTQEACTALCNFLFDKPGLLLASSAIGLLVAAGVLVAFALAATSPISGTALLTATGCGLFAGAATYAECLTADCFRATQMPT